MGHLGFLSTVKGDLQGVGDSERAVSPKSPISLRDDLMRTASWDAAFGFPSFYELNGDRREGGSPQAGDQ